jgi:hypothetical protein
LPRKKGLEPGTPVSEPVSRRNPHKRKSPIHKNWA